MKVRALIACGALLLASAPGAYGVTWPFDAIPIVSRSFGSLENDKIHAGIDIPAARGTSVRGVVSGRITEVNLARSEVVVTDAAGNEYYYGHIEPLAGKSIRKFDAGTPLPANTIQTVTEGVAFARVGGVGIPRPGSFGHLHFEYAKRTPGFDNAIDPLRSLFPKNTVTETNYNYSVTYKPLDGKFPIFGQANTARETGRFIRGHVDLLAEMRDSMGGTKFDGKVSDATHEGTTLNLFKGYSGVPAKVSYSVAKPAYVDSGNIAERVLVDFSGTRTAHAATAGIVYDTPTRSLAASDPTAPAGERGGNKDNYTFIVTHSDGTKPSATNYWNTKAASTGTGDGSGAADTDRNAKALFPDGVYRTGTTGYTVNGLIGGSGEQALTWYYDALINNFKQTAEPEHSGGVAPSNPTGVSDESTTGPETTRAPRPDVTFNVGDRLYVAGGQYLASHAYTAYVLLYKDTWTQGDSLAGALVTETVDSDANGDITGQPLWDKIDRSGQFNIVIDYDGDKQFSWGLDGLGAFQSVPEPASFMLLALGGGLAWLRLRRRLT